MKERPSQSEVKEVVVTVPSITLAFRIARAFGVKVEDVFQFEEA